MAHVSDGAVRLITRAGLDWTKRYGDLPDAFRRLPCRDAVIDGEIVVLDEKGISRFALLQDALSNGAGNKLVFYAFDILHLDGWNLAKSPLEKRKALLAQFLAGHTSGRSAIQLSDHVVGDGQALYDRASELGLEGIVSKRASVPYQSGRSKTWTKTKALNVGDFVIAGYTTSQAAEGLAALALGEWVDGELQYRGKVGTGFDSAMLHNLHERLEPLRSGAIKLDGAPKDIIWVRPVLSARIHYANRTADNSLRHAVFKQLRDVELSTPVSAQRKRLISEADLATIWVTNPTRRLFGKSGPTKLDIAVYYAFVGDFMLPHILGRPVSLVRCPTGRPQDCFFQRHAFTGMPASVATFALTNSEGETKSYLSVEDAKGYLALAQFGVVEFHTWGTTRERLDKPDRITFDLDPGQGIAWREIVEAAVHIRGELDRARPCPVRQDVGRQGHPCRRARRAETQLEEAARGVERHRHAPDRHRAGHLHHDHGQGQPRQADFHRFSPQRAQPHLGRALFAARAHQPAGLDAGGLERSGVHRRAGGFELFFAAGSFGHVRRSLGRY